MSRLSNPWRPLAAVAGLSLLAACAFPPTQQSQADAAYGSALAPSYGTPVSSVAPAPTGMTLYTYDRDSPGRSNCNGECTQYWHPLVANQDARPTDNMTLITRDDGQRQWATTNGSPLYTYAQDSVPGDAYGNNFHNDWHVVQQSRATQWGDAPAIMTRTSAGSVMTTPSGMTLYTYDLDTAGRSNCNGECAQYWHPLVASLNASPIGNMTLITRDDGQRQWATSHGLPLYTYSQDRASGDVNGNNFHNDWHVVQQAQLSPRNDSPTIMTQTSAGNVMTTPTGMTLYTYDLDTTGRSNCNGECAQYWHPLIANQSARQTGSLTLITREDGQRQWATANGTPLYTYIQDRVPGDVKGNNFRTTWHVVS